MDTGQLTKATLPFKFYEKRTWKGTLTFQFDREYTIEVDETDTAETIRGKLRATMAPVVVT